MGNNRFHIGKFKNEFPGYTYTVIDRRGIHEPVFYADMDRAQSFVNSQVKSRFWINATIRRTWEVLDRKEVYVPVIFYNAREARDHMNHMNFHHDDCGLMVNPNLWENAIKMDRALAQHGLWLLSAPWAHNHWAIADQSGAVRWTASALSDFYHIVDDDLVRALEDLDRFSKRPIPIQISKHEHETAIECGLLMLDMNEDYAMWLTVRDNLWVVEYEPDRAICPFGKFASARSIINNLDYLLD